jgi:phosphohistidine phosphatase SixA
LKRKRDKEGKKMFAVIKKADPVRVLRTCGTKEAALIAAQLEKDKVPLPERNLITAVVLDDGGYVDILF